MNVSQTISMAMKSISNNKVRSVLTMLGIIIGVAAVITLVSVIQGMTKVQMLMMESMGINRIDMYYYGNSSRVRQDMLDYAKNELGDYVLGMTPNARTRQKIKYRTKEMDSYITFGNEDYALCSAQTIASGRNITAEDCKRQSRVVVIGEAIRKNFFGAMSPLGQKIKINGQSYTVIGTFDGKYGGKLNTDDQMLLAPHTLQLRINGWENNYAYIIRGTDADAVTKFVDKMTAYMTPKVNMDWGEFYAYSNNQYQESSQQSANMMSAVAGGVAGISLLVGGIGIMNIMLVSVTERTREIGIRMAIGARRKDIIGQFLVEAAAVSACGGIIGIILGFFGSISVGNLVLREVLNSPWMPEMPGMLVMPSAPLVLGAFLFSALLGVIFGLYPANKASKLQPVEALRTQ